MTDKTHIPGKDAPLEETVANVDSFLREISIDLEHASYLHPVEHCWSVHLIAKSCPELYTNGKGTSRLASVASGSGEFIERLATDFFFTDYYLGSKESDNSQFSYFPDEHWFQVENISLNGDHPTTSNNSPPLLSPELLNFYNPDGELTAHHLIDNNFDNSKGSICSLPFTDLRDSSLCYFPISLLNNLYLSNGMAAGNSPSEARAQALCEIVERYVKNIVISEGLSLPQVPENELEQHPHLLSVCEELERSGFSVSIHDSSLGGKFPVICALLVDSKTGGAFAAFGANCRFEIAIERTLTEMLQGRDLDQLHSFNLPVPSIERVADPYNLESHFIDSDGLLAWRMFTESSDYPYSPWAFQGSSEEEEAELTRRIEDAGFTIYRRDYLHCALYCCRFIVPGMSEIYPVEDLVWSNRNRGAFLRSRLLHLPSMTALELEKTLELMENLELDDQTLVSHVIGVLFDSGSNWEILRIGELKAHICLALGDTDQSIAWCNWVIDFAELPSPRKKIFQTILALLQLRSEENSIETLEEKLSRFFLPQEFASALGVVEARERFFGFEFGTSWVDFSKKHAQLLDIYETLKDLKRQQV